MVQYRDIILRRQAREARKQDKQSFKRAVLVDEFGNQTSASPLDDVWAVESERRVWHMVDGAVQPAQILCRKVSDPYVGLGVIIGYAEGSNQLEVLTDDFFLTGTGDPTGWASTAPRDFEPGGLKQMWVYTKVITPLATYPGSGISVNVVSGDYPYLGTRKTFNGSVNFALTSNPNPGEHYLAGLYLDAANTLQVVYGASVVVATTPPEPTWPAGAFRLSAVRINDTQTTIDFADDVFDRRMAWSDEISSSAGWPFANVLSVSTTDPDADYDNVTDAITAASAGDGILLDMESSSETITVNKAVYLIGWARGGTVFTNTITITAAARLYNIKVTHDSVVNARGFVCNQTGVAVLYNCEAVTNGSTTSRAIEQTAAGSTQVYGGYYESSGAGTSFEVFVSAGAVIFYNQPVLFTGAISGNIAGVYTDSGGALAFASGTEMSGGVWLYDANNTRFFYNTLALAAAAAGAGDVIHLFPGTYTLTAQLAYGAGFAIEGEGPETIINCATNSVSLLLLNSAGAALRNLKVTHSGAGILNSGIYITADATVENVTVTLSGAATANYAILQQGGTATLTNVTATASGATTNHAYRNDTGDAVTVFIGGSLSGTQLDIYGERTGSTLATYGTRLETGKVSYTGTYPRQSVQPSPTEPILMNGHPLVWQRGTSFAAIATNTYFADRWIYQKSGDMVHTVSQSSDVPTVATVGCLLNYSILADCTTVDGTIAAGDFAQLRYIVEGYDWLKVAQQQFTLPFWVKATKTGVYCVSFRNSGNDRSYVVEYTVNTTDTWEYKQVTVSASPSAGTWDYTTGAGVRISFALAAGSTYQTTADAWQTGNYLATSNQVNACDSTNNDFRLIVGDLIPGPYARPIVANPYGNYQALLAKCQRYAYVIDNSANTINQGQGAKTATTTIGILFPHPIPMRTAPTLSHNITGYTGGAPGTTTVALINYATNGFFTITGALTVDLVNSGIYFSSLRLTAGTSWDGTAGDLATLRVGPSVIAVLAAEY